MWSSARRPRKWWGSDTSLSARTSLFSCIRDERGVRAARTERKTARGYHGFEFHAAPDVTLEQDLAPRSHHQRHREGRGRPHHRSVQQGPGPQGGCAAAREHARGGSGAHPEGRDLQRDFRSLSPRRPWRSRTMAENGRRTLVARARMAGAFPGLWKRVLAHVRGAARKRRAPACSRKSRRYLEPERTAAAMRLLDEAARQDATQEARFAALGRVLDPLALGRLRIDSSCRGRPGTFGSSRRGTQT